MLMKTTLIAAAAAIAFSGAAIADGAKGPSLMTDEALDTIVAGFTTLQPYSPATSKGEPLIEISKDDLANTIPEVKFPEGGVSNSGDSYFRPIWKSLDGAQAEIAGNSITITSGF